MTKKTRREELLYMFDQRSSESRCTIIKALKAEGREVTHGIDITTDEIKELATEKRGEIQHLQEEVRRIEREADKLYTKKAELLESHKLYTFNNRTCGTDSLHPDLVAFDEEVRKERQDLLMMKLPR